MLHRIAAPLIVALVLSSAHATAATQDVAVDDNVFRPATAGVAVDDQVQWTRANGAFGDHNVQAEKNLFSSGPTTAGPINFTRRFSSGIFSYFCLNHRGSGMRGKVKVPPKLNAKPSGVNFSVKWATGRTNTGSKFDVQFRVGSGKWRKWRTDTGTVKGVFGKGGKPVRPVHGKRYSIRVRSQKKARRQSGWSPVRSIKL